VDLVLLSVGGQALAAFRSRPGGNDDETSFSNQCSWALRAYYPQIVEGVLQVFLSPTEEIDGAVARNGVVIGAHGGFREIGVTCGYGDLASFGHALTNGLVFSLTGDIVHHGNTALPKGAYTGIEFDRTIFNISLAGGVKYALDGSNNVAPFIGIGLRF
jgi:hypothetical protein